MKWVARVYFSLVGAALLYTAGMAIYLEWRARVFVAENDWDSWTPVFDSMGATAYGVFAFWLLVLFLASLAAWRFGREEQTKRQTKCP